MVSQRPAGADANLLVHGPPEPPEHLAALQSVLYHRTALGDALVTTGRR